MKSITTLLILQFFFSSFFFTKSITAQSQWERAAIAYPSKNAPPLNATQLKAYKDFIKADRLRLKECQTDKCKLAKNIRMASFHYLINAPKDTIEFHLNNLFAIDSTRACKALLFFDTQNKPSKNARELEYFAREFSEDWWDNAMIECQPLLEKLPKESKPTPKKEKINNIAFANTLKEMGLKDQEFRTELMEDKENELLWEKQGANDLINRKKLDSLFLLYGFPTVEKVGKDGFLNTWMIIQHSKDCHWNEKWIELYMDHFVAGELKGEGLMPSTIDRFYHPTKGYCPEEDRKKFIAHLKKKYSDEVVYKFGFKDW